jgi:hypothetical protein
MMVMSYHVANHLLLTKLIPTKLQTKTRLHVVIIYATTSKHHEGAPSAHSAYKMLNMPKYGNICSFLSVLYGLRQTG